MQIKTSKKKSGNLAFEICEIRANNDTALIGGVSKTLPKALRTQGLTSNFGLVGLVQYDW